MHPRSHWVWSTRGGRQLSTLSCRLVGPHPRHRADVEPKIEYHADGGPTEACTPGRIVQIELVRTMSDSPAHENREEREGEDGTRIGDHSSAGRYSKELYQACRIL